jgi:hypothetical protein
LELSRLTKESTRGLATPGPFSFCPENPGPHLENRIGMASQTCVVERAPARAQVSPAGRNPAASGCGGANPPRRTITTLLLRALVVPWRGRLPVEQEVAGSIPVEGATPQTHQGGLTGRARGPEPRDGGSSPSPGANPPRPGQVGRRRSAELPGPGSIPGVGSNCWSSSEVERHVEGVRVGGSKPSSSAIPE